MKQKETHASRTLGQEAWFRFKRNRLAMAGLIFIFLLLIISIATVVIDALDHGNLYQELVVKQNLSYRLHAPTMSELGGIFFFF